LLIEADPATERFKVTMLEFAMPNESPQIAAELGTDAFTLRNVSTGVTTTHQIARGTYNMYELAKQFSISTGGTLLCSYLPNQNRLQWTLPAGSQPRGLRMPKGLAHICGLLEDTEYPVNAGSFTVGFYACRPVATANLFVRYNDWTPEAGGLVLSNMSDDGGLRLDGTLAIVNVSNTPPWHWISWTNQTPESGGLYSGDTKLSVLELIVTDEESRQLPIMPEWWCQIKVEVVKIVEDRTHVDLLQKILQTLKDTLMFKYLNRSGR
jgi:hypothetical protein